MRTMIVTMLLPLLALVGVEVFTRTSDVVATPVVAHGDAPASCRVDGTGRLRISKGDGERVLAEPQHFEVAKNGGLTAYAALLPGGLDVLVCSQMGNVLHRTAVPASEVSAATAVRKLRLLSATRAFVELHVNPSTELGLFLDLQTGEQQAYEGHNFSLSPDGRDVAYFREPAHGSPAGAPDRAAVYVNTRRLADVPRDSGLSLRWQGRRALTAYVRSWNGSEETYDLKPF
jgi:hypothetical protein